MRMPFSEEFRVTSPYGSRIDPFTGEKSTHGGIDLVGVDTTVRSVVEGRVLRSRIVTDQSSRTWEWGNYVSIQGDDGLIYYYCHLAARAVEAGETVGEGQPIGIQGATGKVTGPHLHFEVRNSAGTVDPAALLGIENRAGYVWTPEPKYVRQASAWAKEAAAWAVENGIVNGRGEGDYAWQKPITREEAIVMLHRSQNVFLLTTSKK